MPRKILMTTPMLDRLRSLPPRETFHDVATPAVSEAGGGTVRQTLRSMADSGAQGLGSGTVVVRKTFQYQSYFDSVLMERAILTQPPAEPIVPTTRQDEQSGGYSVAVYQSSETPIAVQLVLSGGRSSGVPFIMRPGEVYHSSERFDAIRYGLPFGWLGGGMVQLRILQGEHDNVQFFGQSETVFHRVRLPVYGVAANPAAGVRGASPNWPLQFPWTNAYNFQGTAQKGQPAVAVDSSKTILRLRTNGLLIPGAAGGFRMRLAIFQTDDFDLQADGQTYDGLNVAGSYIDFTWPAANVPSGFRIGGLAGAEFPLVTLDDNAIRVGGSNAIAVFIDLDGALGGAAAFVDVERYGQV